MPRPSLLGGASPMAMAMHTKIPPEDESDKPEANVFVNVYDILPSVNATSRCVSRSKWGIYHTGVEVHGLEIAYGGHSDATTGVFCAKPRTAQGAVFREQVPIGRVDLDPLELRQLVAEVSRQWPGNTYDPFKRNCNHFSDFFCKELTGRSAPSYINQFAKSRAVRGLFYRCVLPVSRLLDRFHDFGGITYTDDTTVASTGEELGISGARGINQVLVEAATAQKVRANQLFKEGSYQEARGAYNKALGYLRTMTRRTEEEDEVLAQAEVVRTALLLNLAACDLKTGDHARAVSECEEVLRVSAGNQKALYRRGVALSYLGKLEEASADLRAVLQMAESEGDAATARDVRRELARVRQAAEADRQKDRALAVRMLGGTSAPVPVPPGAASQQRPLVRHEDGL